MPEVLGTGFRWAFDGEPGPLILRGSDGLVDPATIEGMPGFPRKASQFAELMVLAGPPARRSAGCGGNTGTGRRR